MLAVSAVGAVGESLISYQLSALPSDLSLETVSNFVAGVKNYEARVRRNFF